MCFLGFLSLFLSLDRPQEYHTFRSNFQNRFCPIILRLFLSFSRRASLLFHLRVSRLPFSVSLSRSFSLSPSEPVFVSRRCDLVHRPRLPRRSACVDLVAGPLGARRHFSLAAVGEKIGRPRDPRGREREGGRETERSAEAAAANLAVAVPVVASWSFTPVK